MKKRNHKKEKNETGNNGAMALSFGALNIADYVTTKKILNSGGEEYNPIVDFFIRKNCFGIFKTAATLAGMLAIYVDEKPKMLSKALLGLYGFLVAHNVKEIVQHRRETKSDGA
ncbi:MAG: DUF5658 family protein [Desulfobacterales bacterium]|nr:DUF5658 family protein [Desulfobacterales bacterium]